MFITKYKLNDKNKTVISALGNVDKMHKLVWSLFENLTDFCIGRENLNILYRVQNNKDGVYILIQSKIRPNRSMETSMGKEVYCVDDTVMKKKLEKMNCVNANILVNPIQYVERDSKICRKFITDINKRISWFKNKLSQCGCEVVSAREVKNNFIHDAKEGTNDILSFGISEIQATLKITDFDKFYSVVEKGIGREKSYGVGMFLFGA